MQRVFLTALCGGVSLFFAGAADAAVVFSDNFNIGGADQLNITAGSTVSNFSVATGNIDLIGAGGSYDATFYPGNGQYIDLNGSVPGSITSDFLFDAGTYQVSFKLGNTPNFPARSVTVSLGTAFASVTSNAFGGSFQVFTLMFTTTTAGNLSFVSTGASVGDDDNLAAGPILDDVSVSSAVPEPMSLTLAGLLGAGMFGGAYRRKKRVVV